MNALILLLVTLAVEPVPGPAPSSIQDLDWMTGCWASVGGEAGSGETWTSAAGGSLLGVSRTVKGGRTVAHEFLQIRETAPGKIVLIALPSGQSESTFPLVRLTRQVDSQPGFQEVVFEDPRHDFPQRVVYRRDKDRLLGRIEGKIGGEDKAIDFPLMRTDCPASN